MKRRANGQRGKGIEQGDAVQIGIPHDPADTARPEPLLKFDWIAIACVAAIMLIAPMWATGFATPAHPITFSPDALAEESITSLSLNLWTGPLLLVLAAIALCTIAWREWRRPVAIVGVPGLAAACVALAAWAVFSAAPNRVVYLSLNALSYLFAALLLAAIVARVGRDRQAITALVLTIALAGSVVGGLGVREYLGEMRSGVVDHRTFSTFLNPDFLAGYLLLTLPLTLSAFASAQGRSPRLALGVGVGLQSGCLFLTGSRAGTAIAVAAVVCWLTLALLTGADRTRRRWLLAGAAIFAAASILSAPPTLTRFVSRTPPGGGASPAAGFRAAEDAQGHSGQFRKFTWIGTVRMATRNPVLGTGIGTFATAYPRYSETGFTAHAHNSFLQWTAETGLPGALALLTVLAAASAFVVHVLLVMRARRSEKPIAEPASGVRPLLNAPGLLLAGLSASLIASTMHSLFDSDLYIVATLLTFSVVLSLAVTQARALVSSPPNHVSRSMGRDSWVALLCASVFIVARAGQIGLCRWDRALVPLSHSGNEAIDTARAAAAADPFDPEPHLVLAQLQRGSPQEETELLTAARVAPSGYTYYQLGRYYRERRQWKLALDALERARAYEPHNLQALRALAETQVSANILNSARFTYQTMVALENSTYGTVRAMPELIETDFAYAHAGLADIARSENKLEIADKEYSLAAAILDRYWRTRSWLVNQSRAPEKRAALIDLYLHVLHDRAACLRQLGRESDAVSVEEQSHRVDTDRRADDLKAQMPGS